MSAAAAPRPPLQTGRPLLHDEHRVPLSVRTTQRIVLATGVTVQRTSLRAHLHFADAAALTPSVIEQAIATAHDFATLESGPMLASDAAVLRQLGFTTKDELRLLRLEVGNRRLISKPVRATPAALRIRSTFFDEQLRTVVALDRRAFARDSLDHEMLQWAIRATPVSRIRLALLDDEPVGFALFGKAGRRGYLQRLAVVPEAAHRGIGRALVLDGLAWSRRRRVSRVVVNTQHDNEAALRLYESVGFVETPERLYVVERPIGRCDP